ncbi:MAG: sulfatase-like hydrolase/transferase [Ilumatobacteraceae bacterium]
MGPNVLLITLDQFRADSLSAAGHPVARTPHLDALARDGVRLARHYSQCAPCSPGRASLYTGTYQMQHRVVANGTPLDHRLDNVARLARRHGYDPVVFGYTDQGVDPRATAAPDDARLSSYQGVLPGFHRALDLSEPYDAWREWLVARGHRALPDGYLALLETEPERHEEESITAFLTQRFFDWLDARRGPWFVHLSYLRPHPPYAAAGRWASAVPASTVPLPIAPGARDARHPFHDAATRMPGWAAPADEAGVRHLRAQYYGMIGEVDEHVGRITARLRERGEWDDTLVVVTADHADQLGDHGLVEKLGFFEQSYHIVGIVRDPRRPGGHGRVVEAFTENVDVVPTIAEAIGASVPLQCDGLPLTEWLAGGTPEHWRDAAAWEFDWRHVYVSDDPAGAARNWPRDRRLERQHLAVRRSRDAAYVQFGDGSWLAFDLAADPTWRTPITDPARVLPLAQDMLTWRSRHADRQLTGLVLERGGVGRWPAGVPWRDAPTR